MSLKIFEFFSPRANPIDGDYPTGSVKNASVLGTDDGTPLDATWANDMLGARDALLNAAGITASGTPDTVNSSQVLQATKVVAGRVSGPTFNTIASLKSGVIQDGTDISSSLPPIIDSTDVSATTNGYYDGWAAVLKPMGAAGYMLTTRQRVRDALADPTWEPDGFGDHYLFGGTTYVAKLNTSITNALSYGAKANGVDNDGPAIFAANEATDGNVYFPGGTYVATSDAITIAGPSFNWSGESIDATKIIWNGAGAYITLTGNPISVKPTIENLTLSGLDAATETTATGAIGVTLGDKDEVGGNGVRIRNMLLTGFTDCALKYIGSLSGTIENTQITKCTDYAIKFLEDDVTATTSDNTNLAIKDVNILNNVRGIYIEKLIGAVFTHVNLEGNDNEAVVVEPVADDRVGDILFEELCWFERNFANYGGSASDEIAALDIRNTGEYRFVGDGIKITNTRFINNNDDGALTEAKHVYAGPQALVYVDSSNTYDRPGSTEAIRVDPEARLLSPGVLNGNESLDNEVLYCDRVNGIIKAGRFDQYKGDRSLTPQTRDIKGIILDHSEVNDNGRTITINFSDRSTVIYHMDALSTGDCAALARPIYLMGKGDVWTFPGAYLVLRWDSENVRWQEIDSNFYTNPGLQVQFNNNVLDFSDGPMQRATASTGSVRNFTANALTAYVGKTVSIRYQRGASDVAPTFDAAFFDLSTDVPLFGGLAIGETRVWVCHVDENEIAHEISSYKF